MFRYLQRNVGISSDGMLAVEHMKRSSHPLHVVAVPESLHTQGNFQGNRRGSRAQARGVALFSFHYLSKRNKNRCKKGYFHPKDPRPKKMIYPGFLTLLRELDRSYSPALPRPQLSGRRKRGCGFAQHVGSSGFGIKYDVTRVYKGYLVMRERVVKECWNPAVATRPNAALCPPVP